MPRVSTSIITSSSETLEALQICAFRISYTLRFVVLAPFMRDRVMRHAECFAERLNKNTSFHT